MHVCLYVCKYVCMVCICGHVHVCLCVVYVCACVCMHVSECLCVQCSVPPVGRPRVVHGPTCESQATCSDGRR